MNTSQIFSRFSFRRALAALALLLALAPALHAINVREGIEISDFANDAASASTYTVTTGSNIFSGAVTNDGTLDADYFKISVPPGRVITAIQKTGSATSTLVPPLYAGTYSFSVVVQVLPGNQSPWSFTFTVANAPDYDITTTSGQVILTDHSNFGDTLTLSEPFGGTIQFSAPGRTFSVDGGPFTTGNSGSFIPFNDSSNPTVSVVVNDGTGNDTINVGDFSRTAAFPNLTINGGAGNDTVNFTGKITFGSGRSLDLDLQNDAANPGVDTVNFSAGANVAANFFANILVRCSRNVSVSGGAVLQTQNGNIRIEANQQATATSGNFYGVNISGAGTVIKTTGNGNIVVAGKGGDDGGGFQLGVNVESGAQINGGPGVPSDVTVTGVGGRSTGFVNRGVTIYGTGSAISSQGQESLLSVTGTGGALGSAFGIGVSVLYGGKISGTGTYGTQVTGTGAGAPGSGSNHGVEVAEAGSQINATNYSLYLTAAAGPGGSNGTGLTIYNAATVSAIQILDISAESISFADTASVSSGASGYVKFSPRGSATQVDLGAASTAGVLGISQATLDHVFTPTLIFGLG